MTNSTIKTVIDHAADIASPVLSDDWRICAKRYCVFLIVAIVTIELHRLTDTVTPVFIIGWAWGMLGMYGIMRKR